MQPGPILVSSYLAHLKRIRLPLFLRRLWLQQAAAKASSPPPITLIASDEAASSAKTSLSSLRAATARHHLRMMLLHTQVTVWYQWLKTCIAAAAALLFDRPKNFLKRDRGQGVRDRMSMEDRFRSAVLCPIYLPSVQGKCLRAAPARVWHRQHLVMPSKSLTRARSRPWHIEHLVITAISSICSSSRAGYGNSVVRGYQSCARGEDDGLASVLKLSLIGST